MPDQPSPFAGVKLSEQARPPATGLDQRLFGSPTPPKQPESPVAATPTAPLDPLQKKAPAAPARVATAAEKPANTESPRKPATVRTIKRTNERTTVRTNVRHSFDCWSDQLLALRQIAMERELLVGERVTLGDLVKEAFELFIATERPNERPDK